MKKRQFHIAAGGVAESLPVNYLAGKVFFGVRRRNKHLLKVEWMCSDSPDESICVHVRLRRG